VKVNLRIGGLGLDLCQQVLIVVKGVPQDSLKNKITAQPCSILATEDRANPEPFVPQGKLRRRESFLVACMLCRIPE
jgi:hypothetical protein